MALIHHLQAGSLALAVVATGCGEGPPETRTQAPEVALPLPDFGGEFWLSELGLFTDIGEKRLSPEVVDFEPAHRLWSDGVDKRRWLLMPAGEQIDTSDRQHWQFPVGAQVFKQFSTAGKRLETRLIARTGPGAEDYWMGAFAWLDDESDALFVPGGSENVRDTAHDVPKVRTCGNCHDGEPGRILGFSAVQLPNVDTDLLTDPPDEPYAVTGDETAAAALGYLHANCGHCHNEDGAAYGFTKMNLQLEVDLQAPEGSNAYRTAVGVELEYFEGSDLNLRITPGAPGDSAVFFRMSQRTGASAAFSAGGEKLQMPPIATERVDRRGIAIVQAWIENL